MITPRHAFDDMTDPISPARNTRRSIWGARVALLLILAGAAAIRVHGAAFGLPDLNDADEPLFMMTAFDMLRGPTLNPGWFGHPATITFYCIGLVSLLVGGLGIATGRFADVDGFASAVYADPAILFLPARLFFVACGVICVWQVYRLGRKIGGPDDVRGRMLGLLAAALLAVNAVHIEYSQLIRTDVQASVFMLAVTLCSWNIFRHGRLRDCLFAGIFLGLGIATKWPTAIMALSPLAAIAWLGWCARDRAWALRSAVAFATAAIVSLLIASPFLLLDYATVMENLAGEARKAHPGATGSGFFGNIAWYVSGPLLRSFGLVGLALAGLGVAGLLLRRRDVAIAVAPGFIAMFIVLCAGALVWERWTVPILPFLALAAAWAICTALDWLRARFRRRLPGLELAVLALVAIPMGQSAMAGQAERLNDTRQAAAQWIRDKAPPGSVVLVEHAALGLIGEGWDIRFPLGTAGCINAGDALTGRIKYNEVEDKRAGRPVVDIGNLPPEVLPGCRVDYAIFTHYDGYTGQAVFAKEAGIYRSLAAGGREVAVFRPQPGVRGGPVTRIVQLAR
ncbi:ArnT family glycosyltransferase [Croceibacterium xixiisoli]|nr:glycosyltransferase family 39 protein [Croceibacterium xixiisoli]